MYRDVLRNLQRARARLLEENIEIINRILITEPGELRQKSEAGDVAAQQLLDKANLFMEELDEIRKQETVAQKLVAQDRAQKQANYFHRINYYCFKL